jgi:hypothetical protein
MENLIKLNIDDTDIFLEDLGENQGKITISNTYGHNYSTFWGAMGDNLKDFILRINNDYFANRLLGRASSQEMDVKTTFKAIRDYIRDDIGIAWYEHMDFQKNMREVLTQFQRECEESKSAAFFVDNFNRYFLDRLDYWEVKERYRKSIEESFESMGSEPWYFIHTKPNTKYKFLISLHQKLQQKLSVVEVSA